MNFITNLFLSILAKLPLAWAHRLGNLIGRLLYLLPNSAKTVARINLELCYPELSTQQRQQLLKNTLIENAKGLAESSLIWMADTDLVLKLVTTVKHEQVLANAMEKKRGVLLALPHIGCWEIIGQYLPHHYPVTAMYKPQRSAALDLIIRQSRERNGTKLVPTDTSGVRAVSKALKNGEIVIILPDQQPYLRMKNGVFADFFGQPAYTMTLLSKLAAKTDCEVIYAYTKRLPRGEGFELIFRPATKNQDKQNLQHSVELMNKDVESIVRSDPEQYQWTYKRFKGQPDGTLRKYR